MSVDITINIPDDLGRQLEAYRDRLPELLERGLRDLQLENTPQLADAADIIAILGGHQSPEQIAGLQPSDALQRRMTELLALSKSERLTRAEELELDRYLYLEHLVRLAKGRALEQPASTG